MIKKTLFGCALLSGGLLCALEGTNVDHLEYKTVGTIYPQYKSILGSQVAGFVQEVNVEVGDIVKKGNVILRLDPALFSLAVAEAESLRDLARIECQDAERDFERMKKLFEKPAGETPSISQKRYEDAQSRAQKALISLRKAEEALKRSKRNEEDACIKAPFDGVITKRFVHPGESVTVTPVSKLVELLSTSHPYVEFSVPQRYLHKVHARTAISVRVEGASTEGLSALVDRIFPDIDEKTRAFKCRATLPDAFGSFSGALVEIAIPLQGE